MVLRMFLLFSLINLFNLAYSTDSQCPFVTSNNDFRPNNNKLRVVQYNMEWLFTDYYKNADCPGNGCSWQNDTAIVSHIQHLSNVVNTLQPDIINVCEVQGCNELNSIVQYTSNLYTPYLIKGTDTSTGQNVGLLTKIDPLTNLYRTDIKANYPIPDSKCNYTGTPGQHSVSKNYITELFINHINIALISSHFLSIPTDPDRCAKREAQALVMQQVIRDYIHKDFEIIFIGDLNDYDNEYLDLNSNLPNSQVLDILKGSFTPDYTLFSVLESIPQNLRFSNWWDSQNNCKNLTQNYAMIDHILTTSYLKSHIVNAFVYHGYQEFCGKMDSDHYPLVVDFDFSS